MERYNIPESFEAMQGAIRSYQDDWAQSHRGRD